MTMQELGNLGNFLGSIAVLVTLVYLAVQTRQTSLIAASEAARNAMADFQLVWSALGPSDEFTRLVRRAVNSWSSLNRNEQMRVHSFFVNIVAHFDSALRQEYLPAMKELVVAWENNVLGLIQSSGGRDWYERCSYLFVPEVRERLEIRLARPETLPPSWQAGMPWWNLDDGETHLTAA